MNQEARTCQNCKNQFIIEPEDFAFYKKIQVPAPTFCPQCRYQRRLINRNEWSLYRRKCDATGEMIVSIYNETVPFPVYKQAYWWSDEWDPLQFGQDIDFNRPFFKQFHELSLKVPHLAIANSKSVNSEYSNQSGNNKDCYFVVASNACEKCMYGNWYQNKSYFSCDCYDIEQSELCYECFNLARCYSCTFSQELSDCASCHFSYDLKGCTNCFGCVGLRNKQYCFFNEQLSREDYEARLAKTIWTRGFIDQMRKKAYELSLKIPRKFYHGIKSINFSGDYLQSTKDMVQAYNCRHAENVAYAQDAWWTKDSWDVTEVFSELSYECQGCVVTRCIGTRSMWDTNDSYYSDMCFGSSDLFGCMGLRQKHRCIFNKQYTKEEYGKLKARLIEHMKKTGEWGEYFPASISPFGYNESVAQEYFPLTKKRALEQGLTWYERPERAINLTLHGKDLTGMIKNISESILNEVIQCSSQESSETKARYPLCTTAYTIVPLELELYKKMNIPLPQKCFPCRRQDRFALRNPRQLWQRACACAGTKSKENVYQNRSDHFHTANPCPKTFQTTYAPDRPEIVYCEQCYQAEVA